jgi:hypothetical protein
VSGSPNVSATRIPGGRANERCKICDATSTPFGRARLLAKYDVQYYQCTECRFVQTEKPYWLVEAYASALLAADVGAVQRNLELAEIVQAVVQRFSNADGRFLDYGGGHGLFVRLMRDRGFNFRWHDKYAQNLFSVGFEAPESDHSFELATAFEVLEHLENPVADFGEIVGRGGEAVLCSTQLLPPGNPRPGEWWYYVLSGGQHIALYTRGSLERLAEHFGYSLVSDGTSLHLFSRQRVSERVFRTIIRRRVRVALNRIHRRTSLMASDFTAITGDILR